MPLADFAIDPDIRKAETLPGSVYSDPEVYARMRARVFRETGVHHFHRLLIDFLRAD